VSVLAAAPRWESYLLEYGEGLLSFYASHFGSKPRDVCFILGKGFDPRMCSGIEQIIRIGGEGRRDVVTIEFDEGRASPSRSYAPRVEENLTRLHAMVSTRDRISYRSVEMWRDGLRTSSRSAANLFKSIEEFALYTDVIIDISALPRSIYYPLIAKLLFLVDHGRRNQPLNLHVIVSENPRLDSGIHDEGPDEVADYIHGFRGGSDREATAGQPRVWIPILGEGQKAQLTRIYDLVKPDEIAPLLPSPSLDPRRGDNLVYEYRELLFDQLRIEPTNIIYAAERNPFEAYRQIRRTILQYGRALEPLGGCRSVVSALSTKLLSLGALLAAYELKQAGVDVGIAHVESQGYSIEEEYLEQPTDTQTVLFGLLLGGEYYA
jgi:hypothetical protein